MNSGGEWTLPQQFDEYRLVRVLGRGSMGVVFLGHDTVLDRPVAIKFINARDTNPRTRERFVTEARAAARIQHPNVMAIHRIGELEGRLYIISEYVRGQPLSELKGQIPWQEALTIAVGLARGLAAAHRQGVLHRDIKLANVIRSSETGDVKLLDFGLAKLDADSKDRVPRTPPPMRPEGFDDTEDNGLPRVDIVAPLDSTLGQTNRADSAKAAKIVNEGESSEVIVGTPYYMAPELWRAEPASRSSDIYALGALLYILCAGHPPLEAGSTLELARLSQEATPRPLAEISTGIDPRFAQIVDRCLARSTTARFGSADELCTALEVLLTSGPIAEVVHGNPYRGLQAFEARHRAVFFGRVAEIRTVVDRLRVQPFVLVAGDSGVGKSSLCRAGALPAISEPPGVGNRVWSSVTMIPGRRPLQTLVSALASHLNLKEEALRTLLFGEPEGLVRLIARRQGKDRGFVLFIDQLEELVTLAEGPQVEPFGRFLASFADGAPSLRLLASVRGDFLTRAAALPQIGPFINPAVYLLTPLTREGMREAITGPAALQGVHFESDGLVDELITAGAEGSLPLLQFALAELWEARQAGSKVITAADLERIGRVTGALARHADNVVGGLPPSQRLAVRRLLMRLVTIEDTRASLPLEELTSGDPANEAALEALVRGRLIVAREAQDGTVHEIAHEALIRNWGTLQRWINEEREAREIRHRLEQAAVEWQRLGQGRIGLWTREQLGDAEKLEDASLRTREREFISASHAQLRRSRLIRNVAIAAVPLTLSLIYVGIRVQDSIALAHRVDEKIAEGQQLFERAHERAGEAEGLRRTAMTRFDAMEQTEGETAWTQTTEVSAAADALFKQAALPLDAALGLDPSHPQARELMARLLFERATLLEQQYQGNLADELVARMRLYDDGTYGGLWDAPGVVEIESEPPFAAVTIAQYVRDENMRRVLVDEQALGETPIRDHTLSRGSYLLKLTAPGRAPVVYPFTVDRGERRKLSVALPSADELPAGYDYVPAGRFRFGSNHDEFMRHFLGTVPEHAVETDSYIMGHTEVTFGQWLEYLDALPSEERARISGAEAQASGIGSVGVSLRELGPRRWQLTLRINSDVKYVVPQGEKLVYLGRDANASQDWLQLPATGISWTDGEKYLRWLDATGQVPGARFCTEWEWERAVRGADDRIYPHADRLRPTEANIDMTYGRIATRWGPDAAGSYPASASVFGPVDLLGNIWEWTSSSIKPGERVTRGGSFSFEVVVCSAVNRFVPDPEMRDGTIGLRVCASWPPKRGSG
jgi:serine/threonine protein kinase/formylglycine-generating enzyme required for sulfatase activity